MRLAGGRSRLSAWTDVVKSQVDIQDAPLPPPGQADWAGRLVAFKGVLLEGVEVVLIVSALAARPSGPAPALAGAALALVVVLGAGAWLRKPLARIPETELKWGVGVLLSAFGLFFAGEGLGIEWPGGDAAVLYLICLFGATSHFQAHWLTRHPEPA